MTVAETRAERLAWLAKKLADPISVHRPDGPGSEDFALVMADDLRWLLAQVSGDVVYRVEADYRESDGQQWMLWRGPFWVVDEAREELAKARATDAAGMEYRLASAPVQVWTPVEEEGQ